MQWLTVVVLVVGLFLVKSSFIAISAFVGGLISWLNVGLLDFHSKRQANIFMANAKESVKMMVFSVLLRFLLVSILIALALWSFHLSPTMVVLGLAIGQIGFLLDKGKEIRYVK